MGQVVAGVGVDQLRIGQTVELVLDTLYEDDEHEYMVWKWRPSEDPAGAVGMVGDATGRRDQAGA